MIYPVDSVIHLLNNWGLKSCVTSNAESAIAGLPLTADNYKVAIDILKDRFGKPQLLISNYMDALLKLPSVNSVRETKKLRELFDKIEINIRGLDALGVESQSFGNLLVPIVIEKTPSELRLVVSRKFGSEESWNLDALLSVEQIADKASHTKFNLVRVILVTVQIFFGHQIKLNIDSSTKQTSVTCTTLKTRSREHMFLLSCDPHGGGTVGSAAPGRQTVPYIECTEN